MPVESAHERCPRCLPGIYACLEAVELWWRYACAEDDAERDAAWRAYVEHLDGTPEHRMTDRDERGYEVEAPTG